MTLPDAILLIVASPVVGSLNASAGQVSCAEMCRKGVSHGLGSDAVILYYIDPLY